MNPLPFAFDCPEWLAYVRSLPSVESGHLGCVAHHTIGHGRLGNRKCTDFLALPLTDAEHKRLHDGWRTWEALHGSQLEHAGLILAQACNDRLLLPNLKALRLIAA